jgi:diaminopimelate epimerase
MYQIPFIKMNGLGNDFVMIDGRHHDTNLARPLAQAIANRTAGPGCDQLILIEPSRRAAAFMRVINADGSEVGACGNATRCVARLLGEELNRNEIAIETHAGTLSATLNGDGFVRVDMGVPRFAWNEIPLSRACADTRAIPLTHRLPDGRVLEGPSAVSVGNPHCIFWVTDVKSYDLGAFGPALEHHPLFPERANISLAEVVSRSRVLLSVFERGVGLTQACGTAACAAAIAGARIGKMEREVEVELPGGKLDIEWRASDDHVLMTGPAEFEFAGVLRLDGDARSLSYEITRLP